MTFTPFVPVGGITPPAGDIGGTTASPTVTGTHLAAPLPLAQGGTGFSATSGKALVAALGAAPNLQLVYVDQLAGVDPTGATDSSAAIRAKQTALGAVPYALVFGVGTYLMNNAFVNLGLQQYVIGQGAYLTNFSWSTAGWLGTAVEPGAFNGGHRAGAVKGCSINGPFGSGGVAGLRFAGLQSFQIDDVAFSGLDGGAIQGYKFGASDYAEEWVFTRVSVSECGSTSGYVFNFDGTSFDYGLLNAVIVVEPNIDVIRLSTNGQLQGLNLAFRGNVHGGASNTGAIIAIERGTNGTAYLTNATFDVSLEANNTGGGAVGPYYLWMGSSNAASQFSANGVFNIFTAGATPQLGVGQGLANNANFLPAAFAGRTADPSGGPMTPGDGLAIAGGTCYPPGNANFGVPFAGNMYAQFGDVVAMTLANGATTITINGQNGFCRKLEVFLRQPASGAAGTVTWPANVKWPGGTAPTLSTVNGYVDKVRLVYVPATGFWYGNLDGVHYS